MDLLDHLLIRTSRTFALAIPLLAEPLRRDVTLAYLLFRIADTLEDGVKLTRGERIEALQNLASLLQAADESQASDLSAQWLRCPPSENPDYMKLLEHLPLVIQAILQREPAIGQAIFNHAGRTIDGIVDVVAQSDEDGTLRLVDWDALRHYCYIVAGIVGEMLTELFLVRSHQLAVVATRLRHYAPGFGEGLQLVNILRDRADDAECGRVYLPSTVSLDDVIDLARYDLTEAEAYIDALRSGRAPAAYIAFTSLPARLAHRTLDVVQRAGPGAKLSRAEVAQLYTEVVGKPIPLN